MYNTLWYDNLIKPLYTPSAWVFPLVWTFLYVLIFISLIFFTIKRSRESKIKGYVTFIVQMILNLSWPPVFFELHNIGLAFIIIVLLDIMVILNIKYFYEISRPAAILLLPFLFWILFATYLNFEFLVLNT